MVAAGVSPPVPKMDPKLSCLRVLTQGAASNTPKLLDPNYFTSRYNFPLSQPSLTHFRSHPGECWPNKLSWQLCCIGGCVYLYWSTVQRWAFGHVTQTTRVLFCRFRLKYNISRFYRDFKWNMSVWILLWFPKQCKVLNANPGAVCIPWSVIHQVQPFPVYSAWESPHCMMADMLVSRWCYVQVR